MGKQENDNMDLNFGDIGLDVSIPDMDVLFNLGADFGDIADISENRYIKPKRNPMQDDRVMYDNAEKLARDISIDWNQRVDCMVNGTFIFGDFIEAYLVEHQIQCERMIITTLSLSQENIDSLAGLLDYGYVKQLDMIISAYFYGNEAYSLVPYMYRALDKDNRFQLAVADVHTKTCQFKQTDGKSIVMHGSANLRFSGNVEQFTIEESGELYDWYEEAFDKIIGEYKTINKAVRKSHQWDIITRKRFNNTPDQEE